MKFVVNQQTAAMLEEHGYAADRDFVIGDSAGRILDNVLNPPPEPGPPHVHTFAPAEPDAAAAVAWLRQQIEGDKAAAHAASWDYVDRWNVWGQRSDHAWVIDDQGDEGFTVREFAAADGEAVARHVAIHDPQAAIADCEAKLAILDEHGPFDPASEWLSGYCRTCGELDHHRVAWPCRTVRLLASAYQHRDGYATHWGTPPTHTFTQG
jgi:hypothetical protein